MTNSLSRGGAPGRERLDSQRRGTFKPGHEKRGGRKRGTRNAFSADYKRAIVEAAYRIGSDGNGKDGLIGYFEWLAEYHAPAFVGILLSNLLSHELAEYSTEPDWTIEEINERIREYVGLARNERMKKQAVRSESGSASDWTGQDFPVGSLMHSAVFDPKGFCKLIAGAFLRPPSKLQRGKAARRASKQHQFTADQVRCDAFDPS
jgi:hypothetical protein